MKKLKSFFSFLITKILSPFKFIKKTGSKFSSKLAINNNSLTEALKSKEIRKKLLFTFLIIVVYRILAAVPLPGIDVKLFIEAFGNSPLNNIFTIITGGRLDNPSVVAIGLGAYINASIVIQLLSTVIPKLEDLSKEGERGKQVLNQYTRFLTVPLSLIQGYVIYAVLKNVGQSVPQLNEIIANISTFDIVVMILTLAAGSMVLMWLSELISQYGIGNGSSIIITIGILSSLPGLVTSDFSFIKNDFSLLFQGNFYILANDNFKLLYLVVIGIFLLIMGVVYITEAVRKITIQYARRVRGVEGQPSNYLPLKINQAGVIPVIFASAMLTFPQILSQLVLNAAKPESWIYKAADYINNSFLVTGQTSDSTQPFVYYQLTYFVLIIVFTYFYTFLTYKPSETADNLQKSAAFIPGLRPGKATEKFIAYILLRLTFLGSLFLGVVALLPNLVRFSETGSQLQVLSGIGGTSILIIIGVMLDTIRQMKSMSVTKSYDQYR